MKILENAIQGELDFNKPASLPSNDMFPLNFEKSNRTVAEEIRRDIGNSKEFLVVTGFISLSNIIDFFAKQVDVDKMGKIRIVLGFEPKLRDRKNWGYVELEKDIKEFWLSRNISIFKAAAAS